VARGHRDGGRYQRTRNAAFHDLPHRLDRVCVGVTFNQGCDDFVARPLLMSTWKSSRFSEEMAGKKKQPATVSRGGLI
jgi:hypothetical protein